MRSILLILVGCLTLVLTPGALVAQAEAQTSEGLPRTAGGHPDFSGIYDVATMTPLQRPREFGNRLVLTAEEAAAMEEYERQRNQRDLEPLDPDREAPPVGGDTSPTQSYLETLFRFGGGTVGGYNLFWIVSGDEALTIDGQKRTSIIVDPEDGQVPPMKQEARQRMAALLATRAAPDAGESASGGSSRQYDGPESRPLAERCILGFGSTAGPPALPNYFYNNLKQIVQTDDWVMIYNEMIHDTRVIRIGGERLEPGIKQWLGSSVGRWEGDTLVVETTNFTDKTRFQGSGENLKVTERFSRLDDGTILYRFTAEDPETWDRPWAGEYVWRASDEPLYEYACHEGNYAMETVLRGARVAEAEEAGGQ